MNARIPAPFALGQPGLWDSELERNALGLAMLARPMPPWIAPEHFQPAIHQMLFRAILALGKRTTDDMLPRVASLLRNKGKLFAKSRHGWRSDRHSFPYLLGAVDLAEMCLEAEHSERMGWQVDFERLRELARQRALLETLQRVAIRLRHGDLSHKEARKVLADHFGEHK